MIHKPLKACFQQDHAGVTQAITHQPQYGYSNLAPGSYALTPPGQAPDTAVSLAQGPVVIVTQQPQPTVVVQAPAVQVHPGGRPWTTGLCGCTEDCCVCTYWGGRVGWGQGRVGMQGVGSVAQELG